jgi:hypothetical protein
MMLKILRFLEDFHLALGAGFGLAAAQLEPYVPHVDIVLGEDV